MDIIKTCATAAATAAAIPASLADRYSPRKIARYTTNLAALLPVVNIVVGATRLAFHVALKFEHPDHRTRTEAEQAAKNITGFSSPPLRSRAKDIKMLQAVCEILYVPLPFFWVGRGIYLLATSQDRANDRLQEFHNHELVQMQQAQAAREAETVQVEHGNITADSLKQQLDNKYIIKADCSYDAITKEQNYQPNTHDAPPKNAAYRANGLTALEWASAIGQRNMDKQLEIKLNIHKSPLNTDNDKKLQFEEQFATQLSQQLRTFGYPFSISYGNSKIIEYTPIPSSRQARG